MLEIHEGLNVIEQWNSATEMLQQILAEPHWMDRLTARDLKALTPLIWEHVNPYGRFDLDMTARIPLN